MRERFWMERSLLAALLIILVATSSPGHAVAGWHELNSHRGDSSGSARNSFFQPLTVLMPAAAVTIISVQDSSPAALARIQVGDTLLALDGAAIGTSQALRDHLGLLKSGAVVHVTLGTSHGQRDTSITLRDEPPRLGLAVPGFEFGDTLARIYDAGVTLSAYVRNWNNFTVVRIDTYNTGSNRIVFGPDSVLVSAAGSEVVSPLTPEQAYTMKFGGTVTDDAGEVPSSLAGAIVGGAASGVARATREAATKSIFDNALRTAVVPPGSRHGGALFFDESLVHAPLTLMISASGREYVLKFGQRGAH